MTDESTPRCAVPGCKKAAKNRGLCPMHYFRAGRTNVKDPQRLQALKYMLPSRAGQRPLSHIAHGKRSVGIDGEGDLDDRVPATTPQAKRIDKAVRARGKRASIRFEAMYEFAKAFEIKCIRDNCNGRIFEHPTKPILVRLDDAGELHEVEFTEKGKVQGG